MGDRANPVALRDVSGRSRCYRQSAKIVNLHRVVIMTACGYVLHVTCSLIGETYMILLNWRLTKQNNNE